ncbi:U-scoloptoxin(01)-Cw1a-like isoform X1 [Procambarus clarkii]|uniref:U-scoloptoxin(01)-Cw1a-like isoform X1 n=2 Tax=Procambarus clarkii TaxID=6728 RepID=UPI00374318F7
MFKVTCCVLGVMVAAMAQHPSSFPGNVADGSYPTYSEVPATSFNCEGRWGIFPDTEAGCQVFHICHGRFMYSFLCPNATLFSSNYRICDHYYNVRC